MASNILPDINAPVWEAASPATIWLREIETVHETLSRLRRQATSDRVVYFYVTDPSDRLVGVVPARRLLFSDPATLVGEIMVHPVFSVTQSEPFGCALALLTEQRLLALPVVDEAGRLTGIVDVSAVTQRLFEMERREAADELFQMVGLHALSQPSRASWRILISRFSWLVMSVAAGLLAAFVMQVFHAALRRVVEIAFFVPCVVTVAGSVAMHAVTISLRNRHIARKPNCRLALGLPTLIGGTLCALLAGALVAVWLGPPALALVVSSSLLIACTSGGVLGYCIPRLVHRWRLEPQIASGPIVLALTYLAALASYLALSAALI